MIEKLLDELFWAEAEELFSNYMKEMRTDSFNYHPGSTELIGASEFFLKFINHTDYQVVRQFFNIGMNPSHDDHRLDRTAKLDLSQIMKYLPEVMQGHQSFIINKIIQNKYYQYTRIQGNIVGGSFSPNYFVYGRDDLERKSLSEEKDFNVLYERMIKTQKEAILNSPLYLGKTT